MWFGSDDEEGAARQGVRLAFDNGPGAALRRRGPDNSPAPTAAPCPRPILKTSRPRGSHRFTATCRAAHSCTPGAGWPRRFMLKWNTAPGNHTGLYSAMQELSMTVWGEETLINPRERGMDLIDPC